MWPERVHIWRTTPMCFRKHFGTKQILLSSTVYEIFIHKPNNVLAQTQHFLLTSTTTTIKFLIRITTQGVIFRKHGVVVLVINYRVPEKQKILIFYQICYQVT